MVDGTVLVLEFLADAGDKKGGELQELPSEGAVSAIYIPHSAMVLDHHETVDITAELLNDGGVTTETIRHADIVSFTCLKTSPSITGPNQRMCMTFAIALSIIGVERKHYVLYSR